MTFTKRENPGVFPSPAVELTLAERDGKCTCTWVLAVYRRNGDSRFALKYKHEACPAFAFHRRLDTGERDA